jgi:flagellum-specific peptidoglycan hydrolase FlgJ
MSNMLKKAYKETNNKNTYINKIDELADYMDKANPHQMEYFDNPISDEVYAALVTYHESLAKIAEEYDLDNDDVGMFLKEVNAFIDKHRHWGSK